jgi:hypothetical protein
MTCDMNLKGNPNGKKYQSIKYIFVNTFKLAEILCMYIVDYVFTKLQMKFLPGFGGYKSTSRGRELRRIQTHRPHTMGSKEPKPWSLRWVRQKLRDRNSGLSPNDPSHDEKPPADVEKPLCKCDLDCQSHMTLDHDTYGMRYWSCPQPTCPFHWG